MQVRMWPVLYEPAGGDRSHRPLSPQRQLPLVQGTPGRSSKELCGVEAMCVCVCKELGPACAQCAYFKQGTIHIAGTDLPQVCLAIHICIFLRTACSIFCAYEIGAHSARSQERGSTVFLRPSRFRVFRPVSQSQLLGTSGGV